LLSTKVLILLHSLTQPMLIVGVNWTSFSFCLNYWLLAH